MHLRVLCAGLAGLALSAALITARAEACSKDDFAIAVDKAGASLRSFNAAANPKLKAKLKELKTKKGWPDNNYEARGLDHIQDSRLAALDTEANELLSKVDELGRPDEKAPLDCSKLAELNASGEALLGVMKSKSAYTLEKIDSELAAGDPAKLAAKPAETKEPVAPSKAALAPAPARQPSAGKDSWSTTTAPEAETQHADIQPPPAPLPPPAFITNDQGYTIDEIRDVTRGFFGTISTELASVIEYAFSKSGRPSAYILGSEGGGAFLAGLKYGKGTLYLRSGGSLPVYWHGPSLGGDIGADGSRTLYLIYNLDQPSTLFRRFAGVAGTAYFVGGVGVTFLKGGDVIMAPIRSGLGFRIGANIGYVHFTAQPTWNPF